MKRFALRISLSLLTFITGVAVTSAYFRTPPAITAAETTFSAVAAEQSSGGGDLEVIFNGSEKNEYGQYAAFRVTNGSAETAYYYGYDKNSHCSQLIRYDFFEDIRSSICGCGTGLEEQGLRPGESATFQVQLTKSEPYEVGFDFLFGQNRLKRTYWSGRLR